jgi:hypothetical protein
MHLSVPAAGLSLTLSFTLMFALVPAARAQKSALNNYAVDLFYCQASSTDLTNARRARAHQALEQIKQRQAGVIARVRVLTPGVQARPGYGSTADEIRFVDKGTDKAAAAELAKILGVPAVAVRPVEERTLYLSAFYCAG